MTEETNHKKLVVLIEDEEILSNLLIQKLEKAGFEAKAALDGETGLKLVLETKPDLVLLDMLLPKMNGLNILEKLAEQKIIPALPVIIISNSGQPIEIDRALQLGARDYLIKVNFNPDEVMAKVHKVFSGEIAAAPAANAVPKNGSAKNILIVEDDVFMAGLLERKFKQGKFNIIKASSANQAREVLSSKPVNLILLDVVLPGMDGFSFLRELKASEKFKNIPVMITSNLGQQDEIDRGIAEGAADYIVKAHSTPGEIVQKVEKALN
ncbi:MAG: response regulator [Patescibacteria group bacterium]|nr:response regulator [Patescibacteria group bacterium]